MRTINERADVVPRVADIFRDFGYEAATLSRIKQRTGLGKGSLYHFFPGGKEDMAGAVLADIDAWFESQVFEPLRCGEPHEALDRMWSAVEAYFHSGRRICLVGAFALEETRDRFRPEIEGYFRRWIEALRDCLVRGGRDAEAAVGDAEEAVLGVQGALVLSRAVDDPAIFSRTIERLRSRIRPS